MNGTLTVLFDLYGTLILTLEHQDAWGAWQECLLEFIESKGGEETAGRMKGELGRFWSGEYTERPDYSIFENRIAAFLDLAGLDGHSAEIPALAVKLCDTWQGLLEVDPAAAGVLKSLNETARTGLVTNFDHPAHVKKLLREAGLSELFETIVISAEEGVKKPDPEILHIACRRMNCLPEHTVYVGDSIIDYEAAVAAGITPIIIRRPNQEEIENSRDTGSKYAESDRFLREKNKAGELIIIKSLEEIPVVAGEIA